MALKWLATILSFLSAFSQRPASVTHHTHHRESTTALGSQREGGGPCHGVGSALQATHG